MAIVEIKHRYTGAVLFSCEVDDSVDSGLRMRAVLEKATTQGAYLRGAYLQGADLRGADLRGADLQGADLHGADLQGADLHGAYLQGADLHGADLQGAYLRGAYLQGADLRGAYLQGAYLQGAKNAATAIAMTRILPEGTLIGWKKLRSNVIAKLLIPEYAKRSHAFGRKCRAEFAEVLELHGADIGYSQHDPNFVYRVGDVVKPHEWSEDWQKECAGGIHFWITRAEAEAWQ